MTVVNIHHAKTYLSKLIEEVLAGKEVVIAKAGNPLVKLVPLKKKGKKEERVGGQLEGQIWIAPDFDEADDHIRRMFEGEED